MKSNIDISSPVPYLAKFWFSSFKSKSCWPIKLQDSLKCNISRKKRMMRSIFAMQINIELFYKLILSFLVCIGRHTQSTQNRFEYLCNVSRKMWRMKLIFCLLINAKVSYKLVASLWVCIVRHARST